MKLIFVLLAFFAVAALYQYSGKDERIAEMHMQSERVKEQDAILGRLLAMNDPAVSGFVSEWRQAFPEPATEKLSELREIEQRVKNDKTAVVQMTKAYKAKHSVFCSGEVKSVASMSDDASCPPGL
ncbi:hypothetical protein CJU35_05130 [Pseudomonas aeruginosa]|nr:hypothetical protein [Pseudomonas aeruginosa]PBV09241.1 hypothetical protein CJU35_05130 [Pseudomonas aeruginosa]